MQDILPRTVTELGQINKFVHENADLRIKIDMEIFASKIAKIAHFILQNRNFKMILLAGPSGSGKTTTAKMLEAEILKSGTNAAVISLDHFFVRNETTPKNLDGTYNYESIHALDLTSLQKSLRDLMAKNTCKIPDFCFKTKGRIGETEVDLGEGGIAIVEGIHALNPLILNDLPAENIFKIFVSVQSGIFENDELILSPREMRLIRRMVRDFNFRHASAELTLSMWAGVAKGEKEFIYPHKSTADVSINSMHSFEPCLFAQKAIELFEGVKFNMTGYDLAQKIAKNLKKFAQIDEKILPKESLMREFIGGGIFKY